MKGEWRTVAFDDALKYYRLCCHFFKFLNNKITYNCRDCSKADVFKLIASFIFGTSALRPYVLACFDIALLLKEPNSLTKITSISRTKIRPGTKESIANLLHILIELQKCFLEETDGIYVITIVSDGDGKILKRGE